MLEKMWYKLARVIIKSGKLPIPVADTLCDLLKLIITEEQAEFIIKVFKSKPSLNMEEIKAISDLDDVSIKNTLDDLMNNGIISGTKSKSTGILVYRLMPPFPGIFERQFMRGEIGEKQKKLALIFDTLFSDWSSGIQKNYDSMLKEFKNSPPINKVVPVQEEIGVGNEVVLPSMDVRKIINKHEDIALTHCYCRHEKKLLGDPCKLNAPIQTCLLFGKNAQFSIEYGFAKPIKKEEALEVLSKAEEYGLVHKAFHILQDPERDEEAICNCCKCCCGVFQLHYRGVAPIHTITSYKAIVNKEECIGCETCVEKCPMEAIELIDNIAEINEDKCIGCGVCSHFCPQNALKLENTGSRNVFVPPPILESPIKNL
ncbi:MAG: DUF362 domain-containing protein [Candidatus Hermodarchaeota archaeon]